MSASIYNEKDVEPNDKMLAYDLAEANDLFNKIKQFIENEFGNITPEWKFYNKKSGWILKIFNKKRNVLFIVPCNKFFRVVFTFGEKATNLIYNSELPVFIKEKLFNAKKYKEGRTIQLEVKDEDDLNNILLIIRIKLMK